LAEVGIKTEMSSVSETMALMDRVIDRWREPHGLVAALGIGVLLSVILPAPILWQAICTGSTSLIVAVAWVWSRRLPTAPRNRVGIAIAIGRSDSHAGRQFSMDFVNEIRQLLVRGQTGRSFEVVEIPAHALNGLNLRDESVIGELRHRSRCQFILAGQVRVRKLNGKDHLVLDLAGQVVHKPITEAQQHQFAREFTELLPGRIALPTDQDLLGFTFTGEWVNAVAKYIIGIAAAISGDVDYAESLYSAVRDEASKKTVDSPVADKIVGRLPQRFAELHEARANASFGQWKQSNELQHAQNMKAYLERIDPNLLNAKRYVPLRAISAFVVDEDPDRAIELLEQVKRDADSTWYWNIGFLYAFKGNLKKAMQLYRQGTLGGLPPEIPADIEEFIAWALQAYPKKTQLHYCLGVLNRDVKGDSIRAREEFEEFLRLTPQDQYLKERSQVTGWLDELPKQQD
jgi:tetratricopeptide (TPR) repeat protein